MDLKWNTNTYRGLVETLQQKDFYLGTFSHFISDNFDARKTVCLIRHDIDADLDAALDIAKLEHDLNIQSTFFLMTQSPIYNLFSRSSFRILNQILEMGHEIGLHYDQTFSESIGNHSSQNINNQADMISDFLSIEVRSFSNHQPTKSAFEENNYEGKLISAYTNEKVKKLNYISDSNREIDLAELFKVINNVSTRTSERFFGIQLLIHPMWWIYEDDSTEEVWNEVILKNFRQAENQLLTTERAYGLPRNFKIH